MSGQHVASGVGAMLPLVWRNYCINFFKERFRNNRDRRADDKNDEFVILENAIRPQITQINANGPVA